VQLLEDGALVEALVDHAHLRRVWLLTDLAPRKLVQHVGKRVKNSLKVENLILTPTNRCRIVVNFFKASRISEPVDEHGLEVAHELRLVNRVVAVDQNRELEWQDDRINCTLVECIEQSLHLRGVRSVSREEGQNCGAVTVDAVVSPATLLLAHDVSHGLVDGLRDRAGDRLALRADDQGEALGDGGLLVSIDLRAVNERVQILDDWVDPGQALHEQYQVFEDDSSRRQCRCRVTNRLRVGRLHVHLEALGRRTTFSLDKSKCVVDLQFELLREAIVGNTNEGTANLDNLTFTKLWCEVENVLEAVGGICPDLDVAMHDSSLYDLNEAFDSCREAKERQVRHLLGVAVLQG